MRGGVLLWLSAFTVVCLRRFCLLVFIDGGSMEPALADGSRALVLRTGRLVLRRRMVVLARHPEARPELLGTTDACGRPYSCYVVKRIAALPGDPTPTVELPKASSRHAATDDAPIPSGHVFLLGEVAACEDSRLWGPIDTRDVIGPVIFPWCR